MRLQRPDATAGPPKLQEISYQDALSRAAATLHDAGIEQPRHEARLLLAHVMDLAPRSLPPRNAPLSESAFASALARRAAREPLAYIIGTCGFWTFEVEVSPATLIPRADSETLIEAAIAHIPDRAAVARVLDLGTGTGCLLLAALTEFPAAFGVGTDRIPQAAALAARNAARLGLRRRTAFLVANWADALAGHMDLLLCNPPYIETGQIATLMPEVGGHEPASALDGGNTGLAAYETIIPALPRLLSPHGCAILELGQGQAMAVAAIARAAGFSHIATRADRAGIARALLLHGLP